HSIDCLLHCQPACLLLLRQVLGAQALPAHLGCRNQQAAAHWPGAARPGRELQQSIGRFSASISNGGGGGIDTTGGLTLNPSVYHRMETGHYNTAFESCYAEEERPAWLSGPVGNGFSNGAGGADPSILQIGT
uniref:MEIOC protein n=1 Tax=Macrostomum lignano TaxID=282301 RepID=A0A1I8HA78_9PLAT